MTTDEKTSVPSLINYIRSDLFTFDNISSSVKLSIQNNDTTINWESVIQFLPLEFYQLIENYPNMYVTETFDKKYIRNPKMCAYDRYGSTNMWRPLMILNRCPSIDKFNFKFIRYYNIATFSEVLSILISRKMHDE